MVRDMIECRRFSRSLLKNAYDQLKGLAAQIGEETPAYVKNVLRNHLKCEGD